MAQNNPVSLWGKLRALRWWHWLFWILGAAVGLPLLGAFILVGISMVLAHQPPNWSGFGPDMGPAAPTPIVMDQPAKTLWDWMQLLIVPLVLAVGGYLFSTAAAQRDADRTDKQEEVGRQIAGNRLMDAAMEEYLDHMSQLLLGEQSRGIVQGMMLGKLALHRTNIQKVARARTVTTLRRLDGDRNKLVLQFLRASQLTCAKRGILINLSGAILNGADLSGVDLSEADLSGVVFTNAKLNRADLANSDFSGADLTGADLTGADLGGADFTGATITKAQFAQADSVRGTTGPDGQQVAP